MNQLKVNPVTGQPEFNSKSEIDAAIALLTPVSIRAYGAIGGGIADDTAAIQAALNANREVFFPPGTYSVSSLTLPNGCILRGVGGAKIIARTSGQRVLSTGTSGTLKTGITISNLEIDGNNLTGVQGIYLNAAQEFLLEDLYIHNCGNVSGLAANSTADNGLGGFGIYIESRYGSSPSEDGVIRNCQVDNIAGRGNYSGDGIAIASYSSSSTVRTRNILIEDCTISICGRHTASVAGGSGQTIPLNIQFSNCLFEKASLSGIDIEDGEDVTVSNCIFRNCGNDQTYYNPATVYGSTYNLIAALATSNGDSGGKNLRAEYSTFKDCYVGISYGKADGIILASCIFDGSFTNVKLGLADGPNRFTIENCQFSGLVQYYCSTATLATVKDSNLQAFTANTRNLVVESCSVSSSFDISNCTNSRIVNTIISGTPTFTATVNLQLIRCSFSTVSLAQSSTTANMKFMGCTFEGGGTLANGLSIGYQSVNGLNVVECWFNNFTSHAINTVNANQNRIYQISSCLFTSIGGNGIRFYQGALDGYQILNNRFKSVAGNCFEHILSGTETQANALIAGNQGQATGWGAIASLSGSGSISNWSAFVNDFTQCTAGQISYTGYSAPLLASAIGSTVAAFSHTQAWSTITSTPTTLSGYGITDAVSASAAAITGGSIDNTPIGATTPSTVKTTALTATGTSHTFGANANSSTAVALNGASSANKLLLFQSGGLNRLAFYSSGGGSEPFTVSCYNDAGSYVADVFTIARSTGGMTFNNAATFSSTISATGVIASAGAVRVGSYTVATVPSAVTAGGMIYVSNESGGATIAFSDGTNWRRVHDRAIIS